MNPHSEPETIHPADSPVSVDTLEKGRYKDATLQDIHTQLIQEPAEPTEAYSPIPLFLIFLFAGLMFWAGFYLDRYSGDFRSDIFDPNWKPGSAESQHIEPPFDPIKQGQKLFSRICQQCHQPTGLGIPGVYPPLAGSEWVLGKDERIIKVLLAGMNGPVTVEGHNYDGNMPSFGMWKDRDIAAVLTYIRQDWNNKAPEVLEATVTKIRSELKRTKPWKPEELLQEDPF